MKCHIHVLEESRLLRTEPKSTVRTYNEDFTVDYFICPNCENNVQITHWEDERGKWPDISIPCMKCGSRWSILMR